MNTTLTKISYLTLKILFYRSAIIACVPTVFFLHTSTLVSRGKLQQQKIRKKEGLDRVQKTCLQKKVDMQRNNFNLRSNEVRSNERCL